MLRKASINHHMQKFISVYSVTSFSQLRNPNYVRKLCSLHFPVDWFMTKIKSIHNCDYTF